MPLIMRTLPLSQRGARHERDRLDAAHIISKGKYSFTLHNTDGNGR